MILGAFLDEIGLLFIPTFGNTGNKWRRVKSKGGLLLGANFDRLDRILSTDNKYGANRWAWPFIAKRGNKIRYRFSIKTLKVQKNELLLF